MSQNFQYSDNLTVSEITKSEFFKYLDTRKKPKHDFKTIRSESSSMEELLRGSNIDIHLDSVWDGNKGENRYLGYYEFTDSYDARRFLIVTCEPIHERAYLLDENFKADSISMFGEGELDNNLVFCAHEDFDCDEFVWCKWYSLETGHVVNVASLKELTFGYFVPNLAQCTNPFTDNKGHYFLCIQNKSDGLRKYYKIGVDVNTEQVLTTIDYCGDHIYRNGRLEQVLNDYGYADSTGMLYFYIKDYQGNVRAVIENDGKLLESNSYYPYGMLMAGGNATAQPRKYGTKELDREHGLDLYDSQARWYDPTTGRTTTQDPLREKYYPISPYLWCGGNPVNLTDVNGDTIDVEYSYGFLGLKKTKLRYENGTYFNSDGTEYNGNINGFLVQVKNALSLIGTGKSGQMLVNKLESSKKLFTITDGVTNNYNRVKRKILWNPYNKGIDNNEREAYLGLAHELGHGWDFAVNGFTNLVTLWYIKDGTQIMQSEKIATWWENRIRAEHGVSLRTNYSFTQNDNVLSADSEGSLLIPGTRFSSVINFRGQIFKNPATSLSDLIPFVY